MNDLDLSCTIPFFSISRTLVAIKSSHKSEEKLSKRSKNFVIKFYGAEIRCKKAEKISFLCVQCSLIFISPLAHIFLLNNIYSRVSKRSKKKKFSLFQPLKGCVASAVWIPPEYKCSEDEVDIRACPQKSHNTQQSRKVFENFPTFRLAILSDYAVFFSLKQHRNLYLIFLLLMVLLSRLPSPFIVNEDLFVFQIQNARKCLLSFGCWGDGEFEFLLCFSRTSTSFKFLIEVKWVNFVNIQQTTTEVGRSNESKLKYQMKQFLVISSSTWHRLSLPPKTQLSSY